MHIIIYVYIVIVILVKCITARYDSYRVSHISCPISYLKYLKQSGQCLWNLWNILSIDERLLASGHFFHSFRRPIWSVLGVFAFWFSFCSRVRLNCRTI